MKYTINTAILTNGIIEQKVTCKTEGNLGVNRISHEIFHAKEVQIKEALIKLGWTPPPENKKVIVLSSEQYELLMDNIELHHDSGPDGSGWQSPKLEKLVAHLRCV